MEDIRWKQRYGNYRKAFQQLAEFIQIDHLNKLEVQGLIQCFEYTFELAWKTLKDHLEQEGFHVNSPRSAIQTAFQTDLIADGHIWIDMLEKRNLMAHSYNEQYAEEAQRLIRGQYIAALDDLRAKLEGML